MVIFHSYVSLPEGKPPFSYGFPNVNPKDLQALGLNPRDDQMVSRWHMWQPRYDEPYLVAGSNSALDTAVCLKFWGKP